MSRIIGHTCLVRIVILVLIFPYQERCSESLFLVFKGNINSRLMRIEGKNRKIRNSFTLMVHLGVIEFFRGMAILIEIIEFYFMRVYLSAVID